MGTALDPAAAARQSALLVLDRARETLRVSGPEAKTWLNGVLTCDVTLAGRGVGAFGLLLNRQGKIQSDVYVVEGGGALWAGVAANQGRAVCEALERLLVMEDAELEQVPDGFTWAELHGPRAAEVAARCGNEFGWAFGAVDFTGLGGAALVVPTPQLEALLDWAPRQAVVQATEDDWRRLRIEAGLGSYGIDYGAGDNPHEAALDRRAVSWTKGCYLGQEVVCMQDMRGRVKRRLAALALDAAEPPPVGAAIEAQGVAVGEVTSSAFSAVLGKAVALGRVQAPHFDGAGSLTVAGHRAARLTAVPGFSSEAPPER